MMPRLAVVAALAILLAGCATLRAQQAEQTHYQAMADQVTNAMRVPSIYVRPVPGFHGQYKCRENVLEVGTSATLFLLGHELGHYVLGHGCTESLATEEAANMFAVRALEIWGYSQREAVALVLKKLREAEQVHLNLPAHNWTEEIAALRAEYPEAR
jgi:hypothetical protein